MASKTRIRGITIELGADTSGLDKALKGVNSQLKTTQSALNDVNKLLKSFEQMRSMIKQFSGPGMGKKMKRMRGLGGFGGFPGF